MNPHRNRAQVALVLGVLVSLPSADTRSASVPARDARIVEVTVFPDRAEIVREVSVEISAGASTIEFPDLPLGGEPDSLRVSARGVPAILGAVELRTRADEPKETPEYVAAQAEVRRIEDEIASLDVEDAAARELREFLKALRAAVSERESGKLVEGGASFPTIASVYGFVETKLVEIGKGELERRGQRTDLQRRLGIAHGKLQAARPAGTIQRKVAALEVEAQKAGPLMVRLAFVVPDASWRPAYRASLDAATGDVHLVSEGVVRQQTGEDWSGVALRLSTSAPARGVEPPELASWLLRPVYKAAVGGVSNNDALKGASQGLTNMDAIEEVGVVTAGVGAEYSRAQGGFAAVKSASTRIAELLRSEYNVAFEVPGRSEVPADGSDHRVVLRQETLPGQLEYRTVPELAPSVYLVAKAKAPAGYPLLAGPVRVFAESAYLGSFGLPETGPGEDVTLSFGVDNRVKVERVRLPQERSQQGIIGKDRRIAYSFKTSVKNLRDAKLTVVLEDLIPVAEDERIVIEKGKATTAGWRDVKDRPGILEWKLDLGPGEKKEVALEYAIRLPRGLAVPGVD